MTTVVANVTRMFEAVEPAYVSGSQAELGDQAGRMTWENALRVADCHERWLLCSVDLACEAMQDWARDTGAWDREEIEAWDVRECLALFAQNIAGEIRTCLDADDNFDAIPDMYASTDWEAESEYPIGSYSRSTIDPSQLDGPERHGDTVVAYYCGI